MVSYGFTKSICGSPQAEGGKVYEALHRAAHQIAELRAEHRCRDPLGPGVTGGGNEHPKTSGTWDDDEVTMRV